MCRSQRQQQQTASSQAPSKSVRGQDPAVRCYPCSEASRICEGPVPADPESPCTRYKNKPQKCYVQEDKRRTDAEKRDPAGGALPEVKCYQCSRRNAFCDSAIPSDPKNHCSNCVKRNSHYVTVAVRTQMKENPKCLGCKPNGWCDRNLPSYHTVPASTTESISADILVIMTAFGQQS
jgi:hypothetical protein